MSIIFHFVKLIIVCMIGLTIFQGYSISRLDDQIKIREEECERTFLEVYVATTIMFMLLMRMFIGVFTRSHHEIDWEDDLFEIVDEIVVNNSNHSKKYNIMQTFYIIQIAFGCIGILSGRSMWKYLVDISDSCSCAPLYEFIAFGFFPFLIVSLKNYYKLCVGIILVIATVIVPKKMFTYFDQLLENKYNKNNKCKRNIKLFIGNVPECCVCYEKNCWIIECGHLICKNCIPRIQNLKCPLCKSSIHLVESYENYKKINNLHN